MTALIDGDTIGEGSRACCAFVCSDDGSAYVTGQFVVLELGHGGGVLKDHQHLEALCTDLESSGSSIQIGPANLTALTVVDHASAELAAADENSILADTRIDDVAGRVRKLGFQTRDFSGEPIQCCSSIGDDGGLILGIRCRRAGGSVNQEECEHCSQQHVHHEAVGAGSHLCFLLRSDRDRSEG